MCLREGKGNGVCVLWLCAFISIHLTHSLNMIKRFTGRITRLYEQGADYLGVGEYVEHRFKCSGLIRRIVLIFLHCPESFIFVMNIAVGVYCVVFSAGTPFHLYRIRGFPSQSFIPSLTVIESPSYN